MPKRIRVLVVDDSNYVVVVVSRKLQADPEIEVIGSAGNGIEAIEKVKRLRPDVVTLDVVMPEMDGLTALGRIMLECPTPVVMLSALTSENAISTIQALELGAVDFFLKTSVVKSVGNEADSLIAKIKMAATQRLLKKPIATPGGFTSKDKAPGIRKGSINKIVVIGSSTGGPRALTELIPALPADIQAAILVVQHMPPLFTKSLAERLNQTSKIEVIEAHEGSLITRGQALIAPGDYHMIVGEKGKVLLTQDPPVLGVRPAVDMTMKSVAMTYRDMTLGVVLTGMGSDGTEGAAWIKKTGGKILAQDEATSAIYGMPMSVFKAGHADKILPLNKMAEEITRICESDKVNVSAR